MQHWIRRIILFVGFLSCGVTAAHASLGALNMPVGVTPISYQIYWLHMTCFFVCCGIGAIVFGVMIYSLIKFRKSKGAEAAHFHHNLMVEIIWTTIPFLILVALAVPATIVLKNIHNTDQAGMTLKITGYQWKWKYEYLDQGISFFSNLSTPLDQINNKAPKDQWFLLEVDNPVVVPVNTKIKLLITSDDVIHAWWVPDIGVKQDAIPGFINENWMEITKPGTYRGQCGELCGVNHAFMPIVVQAVSQSDFNQWVLQHSPTALEAQHQEDIKPLPDNELLSKGKAQYEKYCAMCHQPTGVGLPPSFPPLKGSHVVTGMASANIAYVLQGVPGTAMQAFGKQLDNRTLAEIITYIRHAWGNDVLNARHQNALTVQPIDVENARQKK